MEQIIKNWGLNIAIWRFSKFENVGVKCEVDEKTNLNNSKTPKDIQIIYTTQRDTNWALNTIVKRFSNFKRE